jgi:glycosyltransferase involved in cell wall biosynthesis
MRIAIDARYLGAIPSPLAQYAENLVEHLALIDKENEYIVFTHSSFQKTLRAGENFQIRPVRASPLSWRTLMRFHKQVERAEADALHSLFPIVPLFYRGPLIVTIHDLKPLLHREAQSDRFFFTRLFAAAITRRIFPVAVRRATWLTAVSHTTRDSLANVFPSASHKSIVVRSGLEPCYTTALEGSTLDLVLAKYPLPERYVFYSGSVRPTKNISRLLTAFAYLRNSHDSFSDLHLVIDCPPNRWLEETKKLVRRLRLEDVVDIFEQVASSERQAFHVKAKAFCFPCADEGFGFPVLEAQASGVPVLAADSGALPEIAGRGALLANPDHIPSLVEGLRQIVSDEDLRKDLIETGRENAKKYSWTKAAEQVRDVYNLLV